MGAGLAQGGRSFRQEWIVFRLVFAGKTGSDFTMKINP
jgi:hypothetical protein